MRPTEFSLCGLWFVVSSVYNSIRIGPIQFYTGLNRLIFVCNEQVEGDQRVHACSV